MGCITKIITVKIPIFFPPINELILNVTIKVSKLIINGNRWPIKRLVPKALNHKPPKN